MPSIAHLQQPPMLIPLSTDAPVYHFPWATIVVIVVNVALYLAGITPDHDAVKPYLLAYGKGLHPLQWVTYGFLHDSLMTLVVNMIFVWTFGLVVEGKVGAIRFLLLYVGIAALAGGIEQALMQQFGHRQFFAGKASWGAGTATFGLLGLGLVWAPKNEMNCALVVTRPVMVEIAILWLAMIYVLLEFVIALVTGFWILGSIIHVAGALLGVAAGLAMLKLDWVDCEHWDLLAVIAGREGQPPPERLPRESDAERTARLAAQGTDAIEHIDRLLVTDKVDGALAVYKKMSRELPDWRLPEPTLRDLIKALDRGERWSELIPLLGRYVHDFPDRGPRPRLKLAQLLIAHAGRPRLAQQVLAKIPAGSLPEDQERQRRQLEAQARALEPDTLAEPDPTEDW